MNADAKAGPSVARARVPLVDKERATPAQLAVWDRIAQSRGGVAGPFAALLHSPELARRIAETGHYVRFEGPLTQAERELAIITVARVLDAQYEWAAHAVLARKAGVRDEVINAIRERRAPAGLTPAEAQVFAYANGLLREHRVSDEAFAALQKRFGLESLVDLTATIGYYAMIACALNAFGIEPTLSGGEPSQGSPRPLRGGAAAARLIHRGRIAMSAKDFPVFDCDSHVVEPPGDMGRVRAGPQPRVGEDPVLLPHRQRPALSSTAAWCRPRASARTPPRSAGRAGTRRRWAS